jgi:hypothetical protein
MSPPRMLISYTNLLRSPPRSRVLTLWGKNSATLGARSIFHSEDPLLPIVWMFQKDKD